MGIVNAYSQNCTKTALSLQLFLSGGVLVILEVPFHLRQDCHLNALGTKSERTGANIEDKIQKRRYPWGHDIDCNCLQKSAQDPLEKRTRLV